MRYLTAVPLKLKTQNGEVDLMPGDTFTPKNEDAIRGLLAEGKVRPVAEVMAEKYNDLTAWLHSFNLTVDELKDTIPSSYQDIQDAIEKLDNAFVLEDMQAFQDAFDKVRLLYTEAMLRCGRRIAVRVYSEILQAYLWVVDIDEDMHSLRGQGVSEAIYTHDEIKRLKGIDKYPLNEIHKVKEIFPESTIEEANNQQDKK